MFRAFGTPLRARVPYALLFSHNLVLERVFKAPAQKVALTVETPSKSVIEHTYGQLQRDVIGMANLLVARREAVAKARGDQSLSWQQPQRPAHVRSVFSQGERMPSCDYLQDTGFYTVSLMAGRGYLFVVSLLACWAINQLATPLSMSQLYDDELMHVLRNSGSRTIIGETALLKEKLPVQYEPLYVRTTREVGQVSAAARRKLSNDELGVFSVDSIIDVQLLVAEDWRYDQGGDEGSAARHSHPNLRINPTLEVELLGAVLDAPRPMQTAEDVIQRLEFEKSAAAEHEESRLQALLRAQHKEANSGPESAVEDDILCYCTESLHELNPLFFRWHTDSTSRPARGDDCLILYTSGTTARPKGVVHTHASVANMVRVLQEAWEWRSEDCVLHVLPFHHIHGLVNILCCALASGASCVVMPFDNPARIAHRLEQGDITLFMAVPTVYTKLIKDIQRKFSPIEKAGFRKACGEAVRLMVSGSAALPETTLRQFRELSGHTLLERYGMTEVGMALGQPLRPVSSRIPGTVGAPFPTVMIMVYRPGGGEGDAKAAEDEFDEAGSLAIASESLFDRYWNDPVATKKELRVDEQGLRFFDTGDTVGVRHTAEGNAPAVYTILGRTSCDIIKSRGYKLSALEIEATLLSRTDLFAEVVIVGTKDEVQGEKIVAVVVLQPEAVAAYSVPYATAFRTYESDEMNARLREVALRVLAAYKCPMRFICVPEILRNATGKVNKRALKKMLHLS